MYPHRVYTPSNSQTSTMNNLPIGSSSSSSTGPNINDISLLLGATILPPPTSTGNIASSSSTQSRKWFWRNSDKNPQSNIPNDRNPMLQAIVETDTLASTNTIQSSSNPTGNAAGVGEIKLLEKELLNLPSFQLSDSQNPLLPSPNCLNYDFTGQFDPTTTDRQQHSSALNIKGQQLNNITHGGLKSKMNDEDCK